MILPIWHHLQVHQECPCPPWLQEKTCRTGEVLTWFLMSDLNETSTDTSDECFLPYETVSRSIRNTHVLLESRKRHGGQEKYWHSYWYQILIKIPINKTKLSQTLLMNVSSHLTPSPGQSGMSSKTPGRNLGGWVESWHGFWCQILMKLSKMLLMYFTSSLTQSPGQSGIFMSSKTPGRDLEDRLD